MGQAYDDHGRVLGSATGQTKREVFEELNAKYPDAMEIRIRRLGGEHGATGDAHQAGPLDEIRLAMQDKADRIARELSPKGRT